jgi:hypothetical protein
MKFKVVCTVHDECDVIIADNVGREILVGVATMDGGDFELADGDLYCNFNSEKYNGFEGHNFEPRPM